MPKPDRHTTAGLPRGKLAARTLGEVAELLGLSRGVVLRIEQRALRKLRGNPLLRRLAREALIEGLRR